MVAHPGVKSSICEEGTEPNVPIHDSIYYLAPSGLRVSDGAVEDVLLGIVAFLPINLITWNPHIAILPEHRGCGTEVMRKSIDWMFTNTPCEKIVAYPPAFNTPMIRVFEKCGFRVEGCSPKSFMWKGIRHARLLMGKEKS